MTGQGKASSTIQARKGICEVCFVVIDVVHICMRTSVFVVQIHGFEYQAKEEEKEEKKYNELHTGINDVKRISEFFL